MKKKQGKETISKWTPYCIVTNRDTIVKNDVLDGYRTAESKQLSKDAFADSDYEKDSLVKPLYAPLTMAKLLEINTYHMRACRTKAEDVAGNGWKLIPKVDNPSEEQKEAIENFIKGQDEPIENIIKKLQLDKELVGYFSMEVAREGNDFDGKVNLIKHIPAHTVRIHKEGNKYCQFRNNKKTWFRNYDYEKDIRQDNGVESKGKGLTKEIRGNELIWNVNYTPRSCFYGIPDITPAIGAITGDISRRDYNIAFFNNYGVPAYMVSISGDFDPGDVNPDTGKTKLVEQIEEKFKEVIRNPQSVMILTIPKSENALGGEITIKVEPLSTDIKEASFRLYRVDNRNEVITAHAIPPYRMGIYEIGSLAGNLGAESTKIYYSSVILPRQEVYNNIMNFDILPTLLEITDWKWVLNSIDLEDIDRDIDRIVKLIINGIMTPNEAIEFIGGKFGIEKCEDNPAMDMHYIGGYAIDKGVFIPESEITGVLQGMKEKLIEVFIEDVRKTSIKTTDGDRRIIKAITNLEKDSRKNNTGRK
jgi:PBSX family phage portal protein